MAGQSDDPPGSARASGDATVAEGATVLETRSAPDSVPRVAVGPVPLPGDKVGRFTVLAQLGAGGMGVVVAAHDPTLDRTVAIKMLHGERWAGALTRGRDRLIAEAQAMARLAHPNVVALHEIGFDRDGAFLVMEHVAGTDLRGWLETDRPWPEVLAMFLAAGEGLAAAHRAGLVHRDFKPDNVLVDRGGRARVGDFGIAAIVEGTPAVGSRSGTLPYMAPEQLRGEPCDARADQFAFCVALWAALHGHRPFAGETEADLLAEIDARRFAEPLRRPPDWLRRALVRGLAPDPAARWPSMAALLAALRHDPRVRRRRLGLGLGGAVLAAAALWLAWPGTQAIDPCSSAAARLAGVWDPARELAVHAAFLSTGLPYAEATWRGVDARLDRYARSWIAMADQTCRATRVDGRQSDHLMDLRMACLEQRRGVLGATSTLWARGVDGDALEHAIDAAAQLPPIAACADDRALTERVAQPTDPAQLGLLAAARSELDALQAALLTHRLAEARAIAASARTRADAAGWLPLRAEVGVAEGELLAALDDAGAEARLIAAMQLADAARDDRLRLRALLLLVQDLAGRQQKAADALRFADLADGALARIGDDEAMRGSLLRARGVALFTAAKFADARAALGRARDLLTRALGPADLATLATTGDLARTASAQGDHPAARALYDGALAVAVPVLGEDHPEVARLLTSLADELYESGDITASAATYRRALAVDERTFGPDAPHTALTLHNLARLEGERGDLARARPLFRRALAIRERAYGPGHPFVAATLSNLAMLDFDDGRYDAAVAGIERVLAIKLATYGPEHPSTATTYYQLGQILQQGQNDPPRALAAFQRAAELRREVLGADHDDTQVALAAVGQVLREQHRCAEAAPLLEHAYGVLHRTGGQENIEADLLVDRAACDLDFGRPAPALAKLATCRALATRLDADAATMGEVDFLTGRAEWELGHRAAGVRWVRRAEAEVGAGPGSAVAQAEIRAWLAAHPR
jgi:tetratricopeptide (TPR) repeat protein